MPELPIRTKTFFRLKKNQQPECFFCDSYRVHCVRCILKKPDNAASAPQDQVSLDADTVAEIRGIINEPGKVAQIQKSSREQKQEGKPTKPDGKT